MKSLASVISYWMISVLIVLDTQADVQDMPTTVIAHPGQNVELMCTVTADYSNQTAAWVIQQMEPYSLQQLHNGILTGYSTNGNNLIIENIMMNDNRNDTEYNCVVVWKDDMQEILEMGHTIILFVMVPTSTSNMASITTSTSFQSATFTPRPITPATTEQISTGLISTMSLQASTTSLTTTTRSISTTSKHISKSTSTMQTSTTSKRISTTFRLTSSMYTSISTSKTSKATPTTISRVISTTTKMTSTSSRPTFITTSISTSTANLLTTTIKTFAVIPTVIPKKVPAMVPDIAVNDNTINISENNVTLTLAWKEPFNNLDPIVNYTVSCSGDVTCPPNFTTTDNTTRNYTITNLTTMTTYTFSVVATNSIGSGEAGVVVITTPPAIGQVEEVSLICKPDGVINICTIMWMLVTQGDITGYLVYYNGTMMNVNSSTTTLTFTAPSLPDDVFTGIVAVMVTAISRYGVGPASNPVAAIIVTSSVTSITVTLIAPNVTSELYNITVTCTIHPDSIADQCVVMAMDDGRVTRTGNASINNDTMVAVIVRALQCGVQYIITAGGMFDNGTLVGPTMSHDSTVTSPCPTTDDDEDSANILLSIIIIILAAVAIVLCCAAMDTAFYYCCKRKETHQHKEKDKHPSLIYVSIIIIGILTCGTSVLLWWLYKKLCSSKEEAQSAISLKAKRAPAISKKLIELEELGDKPIAKTAPKQSVGTEDAYAVSNVAYSKIIHTQPMICSGYSVVGPNEVDNTPVSKHPGYSNIELQNSTPHQNTADVAKYAEPSKGGAKNKNKYQGIAYADLQELPMSEGRHMPNFDARTQYAELC